MTDGGRRKAAVMLCRQDCVPAAGDREGPCGPNRPISHHHLANQTITKSCPKSEKIRDDGSPVGPPLSVSLMCRCADVERLISVVR
jgi:hypothetical protein